MQLACSSATLDHLFKRGEITQLEWIDLSARSLPVEGLVFELKHFPRRDAEYVAEVRKLCVDRSLTLAALAVDELFSLEQDEVETVFAFAVNFGVPLVLAGPPADGGSVPAYAWRDAAGRGKFAARLAKRCNVTIAVRNERDSLCPDAAGLKRLTKDIDSSWVRFAPDVATLPPEDVVALRPRSVILSTSEFAPLHIEPERKGFLVVDVRDDRLELAETIALIKAYGAQMRQVQ